MPQKSNKTPAYRQRSGYDQAIVTLTDAVTKRRRDYWLGEYGTPASRERYHRLIAAWEATGRRHPDPIDAGIERRVKDEPTADDGRATVAMVIAAYWRWAQRYYQPNESGTLRVALRMLRQYHGTEAAEDFGPRKLMALREAMIAGDETCDPPRPAWSRGYINQQVQRLRRMFRWAASREMIPSSVHQSLDTVEALKRGRTTAREGKKVRPVPRERIDAVRPFVSRQVAAEPIRAGAIGRCVLHGVTAARITVQIEEDETCELKAEETLLATTPLGGVPILWKEEGTGEKWAVIELGRPSLARVTAVLGEAQPIPGESNRWRYPWAEARIDGDAGSADYLRYVEVPEGLSSRSQGGGEDPARMAINRFEAHHCDESVPGEGFEGLLGLGPVCDLPGVLPDCPPARSLEPRLAPVPPGVTVQLTCERDTKGQPVWVFEAMSCVEIADPADGDRKLNVIAAGGGG